jgi:hypothetical protein
MNLVEEIVISLPLIATAVLLMWPEKRYTLTPLHERKEPTLRKEL